MDVLRCSECVCVGDTREGCFGSALAVVDSLLAVGNALNGSGAQFTCFSGTKVQKLTQLLVAVGNALNSTVQCCCTSARWWGQRGTGLRSDGNSATFSSGCLVQKYKY